MFRFLFLLAFSTFALFSNDFQASFESTITSDQSALVEYNGPQNLDHLLRL